MSLPLTRKLEMRANGVAKNAIQSQDIRPRTFFSRIAALSSLVCFTFLQSVSTAATVNVSIDSAVNAIQVAGTTGDSVPDGTALFVVSYKTTQDAFFTALRGASSASDLVAVFSNQLKFFNAVPFLKGDYGTYDNPDIGWSSEGGPLRKLTPQPLRICRFSPCFRPAQTSWTPGLIFFWLNPAAQPLTLTSRKISVLQAST